MVSPGDEGEEDDLEKAKEYRIQTRLPTSVQAVWDEWFGLNSYANQPIPGGIHECEKRFGTKWRSFTPSSAEGKFLSRMKTFVGAVETAATQDGRSVPATLDEFDRVFSMETDSSFSGLLNNLLEKGYWQRGKKRKKKVNGSGRRQQQEEEQEEEVQQLVAEL